jgi:hypothetical protein
MDIPANSQVFFERAADAVYNPIFIDSFFLGRSELRNSYGFRIHDNDGKPVVSFYTSQDDAIDGLLCWLEPVRWYTVRQKFNLFMQKYVYVDSVARVIAGLWCNQIKHVAINPYFGGLDNRYRFKASFDPTNTKEMLPYLLAHLRTVRKQATPEMEQLIIDRINENEYVTPQELSPVFSEIGNKCDLKTADSDKSNLLEAVELLGPQEPCSKCGEVDWVRVSLSSNKKAAKWKCNFCNFTLLLRADALRQNEKSNGSQREPIPKAIQREVWQRDKGRCVECGSQERLEFDHIIPVSKGGANTARNLQLLCESCNRRKSGKAPGHH